MNINIGQNSSALGIMFKVIKHSVNLIHIALFIMMLYAHLIAVCFADASVFISPCVPDIASQVIDIV